MSTEVKFDRADAFKRIDTGTLDDLMRASAKIDGTLWTRIDASMEFGTTALFSMLRLVEHVARSVVSLIGAFSASGRAFLMQNLHRAVIDLAGIAIGAIGIVYPDAGKNLTGKVIEYLNENHLNFSLISKTQVEKFEISKEIWLGRMFYLKAQGIVGTAKLTPKQA